MTRILEEAEAIKEKNTDTDLLSSGQIQLASQYGEERQRKMIYGVGGSSMVIPKPAHIKREDELVFESDQSNAAIVIGKDRPSSLLSGYGGLGHQKSSTIRLTAGRVSQYSRTSFNIDGEEQLAYADPNFQYDASTIYISEKTDVDKNFNISKTLKFNTTPNIKARAAIGIKSNLVRVVGEEGVKIVTGVHNKGNKTPAGIQLIAMNKDQGALSVQPFVKGRDFLASQLWMLQEMVALNGKLREVIVAQIAFSQIMKEHNHFSSAPGFSGTQPVLAIPVSDVEKTGEIDRAEFVYNADEIIDELKGIDEDLEIQLTNLSYWEQIFTNPKSESYLLSRFNGTN